MFNFSIIYLIFYFFQPGQALPGTVALSMLHIYIHHLSALLDQVRLTFPGNYKESEANCLLQTVDT